MSEEESRASLPRIGSTRSSAPKSALEFRVRSADLKSLNRDVPEGMSLRTMDLMTNPNEDDLAKNLVRQGILGIDDALEIVDSEGRVVGSKVLPHAEPRYLEELASAEAARTERSYSWLSSPGITSELLLPELLESETDLAEVVSNEGGSNDEEEMEQEEIAEVQVEKVIPRLRYPTTVESLYELIEPTREDEFNKEIENLNHQLCDIQRETCLQHRDRKIQREKKFQLEKDIILESVTEADILYLPGNFLHPIVGRRIGDADLAFILETAAEIKELKGFNFAYNEITDEGLTNLAYYIKDHTSIIHLNISHNDFTAKGFHSLILCLVNRAELRSLKITGVKVGDEGINSLTCLYMCGRGPRDLDVSETDMTMPGFQALCSAFQAVDEDDDYPKFLTKHKLPFTLETLAQMKVENHERTKAETYNTLRHSHFELLPTDDNNDRPVEEEVVTELTENSTQEVQPDEIAENIMDGVTEALEGLFTVTLTGAGDAHHKTVDLSAEADQIYNYLEQAQTYTETEDFIKEHKLIRQVGCKSARTDGRPVIICPSLYSLEIDEFVDDEESMKQSQLAHQRVNPLYMDLLVEPAVAEDEARDMEKEVPDTLTAQRATVQFVRDTIKDAGAVAGITEYNRDTDSTQLLLITILETAKKFLEVEEDGGDLTSPELKTIWEHCMATSMKIFRPAIPTHCNITEETIELFVEQFTKVANKTFYYLLQNPFLYEMFEAAATRGCIDATKAKEQEEAGYATTAEPLPHNRVMDVVLKFLEEVVLRAGEIIGSGDPYDLRGTFLMKRTRSEKLPDIKTWPAVTDITEEIVEPLVDKFFTAGVLLAEDAARYKKENEDSREEGIEPAQQFLEGMFDELADFLYQIKDDERKLAESFGKSPKKFTFSTRPVRLVLNRPFFNGYEPIMASKLAAFLRNNESVQCLHLRKWGLGEDGMVNLMEGLLYNMNIVTLDLACNGIGAEGLRPLGEYLKKNQNLRHLLLNHNRLRNPGVQVLTNVLRDSSLISLNIAFNDVTDIGLDPFFHAVRGSKLHSLCVLGNCFSQSSWMLLHELFRLGFLYKPECDVTLQEIDGEGVIVRNSQYRDVNEWYEVPAQIDIGLVCPSFHLEYYPPPKATVFGAVDVEI